MSVTGYPAEVGMYVSVRGWLRFDHGQRARVQGVIDAAQDEHYSHGWAIPDPVNWTSSAFFGCDVRESAVGWVRAQVEAMACVPPIDADEDYPVGLFVLDDERSRVWVWEIDNGGIREREAPELRWLVKP